MRDVSVDPARPPLTARRRTQLGLGFLAFAWLGLACDPEAGPTDAALDAARLRPGPDASLPQRDAGVDAGLDMGPGDFGSADLSPRDDGGEGPDMGPTEPGPFGREIVSFSPGEGAGFGQDRLPTVVLGPPMGSGSGAGSLDVLSLGAGGEIVLDLGAFYDGPGLDLVVFENPFWVSGDPSMPFAELGEVSVSTDAASWRSFDCDMEGDGAGRYPGCAGWTPTMRFDPSMRPLDPVVTGGDAFDLAELGLRSARYVRIRDLSRLGGAPSAGFDLDGVGVVYPTLP